MPRPNIMWLWSAITLVIIGYWIFSNEEFAPVKSDWATVEQMVESGDVEKIVVVNRDEARVELKEGRAATYSDCLPTQSSPKIEAARRAWAVASIK